LVWVVSFEDNMVARIDTTTHAVTARQSLLAEIPVGRRPLALAAASGKIWVRCEQDSAVLGGQVSRVAP